MFVVERIGRRRLALGSLLGVFLSLAFLGIGFHLADMNTPLVQVKEDWSGDCPLNKDCGTCIDDHNDCGFCFIKPNGDDEGLASNASCVKVSDKDSKFAEHGRCANPMSNEMKFATDYCPSNTAWLIILGLISYLFFFAPGMQGDQMWRFKAKFWLCLTYVFWLFLTFFTLFDNVHLVTLQVWDLCLGQSTLKFILYGQEVWVTLLPHLQIGL